MSAGQWWFNVRASNTEPMLRLNLDATTMAHSVEARVPFLAANLHENGRPVEWPNVRQSTLVEAAGVKVGVIGVMTPTVPAAPGSR